MTNKDGRLMLQVVSMPFERPAPKLPRCLFSLLSFYSLSFSNGERKPILNCRVVASSVELFEKFSLMPSEDSSTCLESTKAALMVIINFQPLK